MTTDPLRIFVISMPHSTERRAAISARLGALGLEFSFFDGIYGKNVDMHRHPLYAGTRRRLFFGKDLTAGEFGCLLSHRGVYQRIVDENVPRALVLEDDAILTDDVPAVLAAVAASSVPWDIIRFLGSEKTYRLSRAVAPLTKAYELTRATSTPAGAYGYLLSQNGARRLLACTQKNWQPVDMIQGQAWKTGLDVFCVRPSPILPDYDVPSTIGDGRFDKTRHLKNWERALYPLSRLGLKIYDMAGKAAMRRMNAAREKSLKN